jgi:acyl-CoA reductase-like NAD-dependent aldehyde dehydrogenase
MTSLTLPITLPPEVSLQTSTTAFLAHPEQRLLINGEWVPAQNGEVFETINPANGQPIGRVALAGPADVDLAVQAARQAFEGEWSRLPGEERGRLLWKVAELIEANADQLAELETLDNGKPLRVSRHGDIPFAARHFRYYAGWAGKLEGASIPVSIANQFVYTRQEPLGVVGLIIPWNFPLLMAAWKLAPALACGNTALLKPAEETPLTALRLGELFIEAGFPPGVLNILTGPGLPTGAAIVAHPGVDKVSFTGSTQVGREIMKNAALSNLKRVSLELGGKSPNVIFADADLSKAVKGAVWAIFSTSGQECVAGSRLFVEKSIFQEVVAGLVQEAARIRVGNGFGPRVHLGPLISAGQLERVLGYIEAGRHSGAELVSGGARLAGEHAQGYFLPPTIFTHNDDSLPLVQEEIFGPVAAVTPFEDLSELVQRANQTRYGLAAGVWTRDISKAHRFAQAVHAGTVWVNTYGLFDAAAPFGGYKESGFGREMGREALSLYTQTKTVWINL